MLLNPTHKWRSATPALLATVLACFSPVNAQDTSEATTPVEEVASPVETLSMLQGTGALLSLASGLRGMQFDEAANETVIASMQSAFTDSAVAAELEPNIPTTVQFMQDRLMAVNNGAELVAADELTLKTVGYMLASRSGLTQMGFNEADFPEIIDGVRFGLNPNLSEGEIQAQLPNIQAFLTERQNAFEQRAITERKSEMATFLNEIATQDGVEKDPSGFYYKIETPGTDPKPTMADSVQVHYKGTLIDGTQFDSSYDRGQPSTFGMTGVIKGFSGGLTKIGAGGKVTIYIPSDLGYGDNPRPGGVIKPGDTLIFECELIAINP
ncbi:MAG: FKBP-type peptidyl-prolyl cis-trans isomerase [Opitutales bacterium]|nr:FKBP-type peptidyl-prolyl cis-trans isomerase [Opitutales bacterium]NRA28256.1 FKBP-type peptidyl-prolyl cis-trans isomerase [Opitutales bacterium]